MQNWWIYQGTGLPHDEIGKLPPPPPWRSVHQGRMIERPLAKEALSFRFFIMPEQIELINAAIYLRRPMLITGKPGSGKSTLARAIAHELNLGQVLIWPITSRSTLDESLYRYDAIARLHDTSLQKDEASDIGKYIRLGPLGTALLPTRVPRVLLIDEIDKSDIDLPNDLLHVFERGEYEIPELTRISTRQREAAVVPFDSISEEDKVVIEQGRIASFAFPIIVMTSNGEREFPPAFLRRCIRITMPQPDTTQLQQIVSSHLGVPLSQQINFLIETFEGKQLQGDVATDQLLNAVYLSLHQVDLQTNDDLRQTILQQLSQREEL